MNSARLRATVQDAVPAIGRITAITIAAIIISYYYNYAFMFREPDEREKLVHILAMGEHELQHSSDLQADAKKEMVSANKEMQSINMQLV